MVNSKKSSFGWVAVGILGAFVVCLCLFSVLAVSLFFFNPRSEPTPISPEPTTEPLDTGDTLSTLSAVEVPLADPAAIAERLLGLEDVPRTVAQEA